LGSFALAAGRASRPGDIVKGDTALQTGGNSRAELQFPDLTITRVGSNALFRFIAGTREMILDSGTLLFFSPKGAGGGKVQAGAITAAVTGTDFMISNVGKVKVICLSHKVAVYFTANPKVRVELLPGQMLDIAAGANRKIPPVTTINLGKLLASSMLAVSGGFGPLPSQPILAQNTSRQLKAFGLAKASLTSESAEMVRSTTAVTDNPPSQLLLSRIRFRKCLPLKRATLLLTIPEIVNITPPYEELGTNLDERGPDGEACHLLDIGLCGRQTKGDFCDFV
jgi:FecR protein